MRKITLALVSALAGAVIASALPAGAHHSRSTRRLSNRVAALETLMYDCTFVQGMTSYGVPEDGFGYSYQTPGEELLTTAIDFHFDSTRQPHVWTLVSDPSCINMSREVSGPGYRRFKSEYSQTRQR